MKLLKIISLFVVITFLTSFSHPFHASITKCEYNAQTKNLEVTVRLFTDDLGEAIGREVSEKKSTEQDKLIDQYVSDRLKIKTREGLELKTIYLGRQTDLDLTYVFMEVPSFPLENAYLVSQTVFFDRFDDQTNIVNFSVNGSSGAGYFTRDETIKTIHLE